MKEVSSKDASPETNIYYTNGKHKLENLIIKQVQKPAKVSYIMDHGTSILHTHEYCYMSYLKIDSKLGITFSQNVLFNYYSMTFSQSAPIQIPPAVLQAARSYLEDRREYLGYLN